MRERLSLVGNQMAEQFEFFGREVHLLAASRYATGLEINVELLGDKLWKLLVQRRSSKRRANARQQLLHTEGLHDIVVCAGIQCADLVSLGIPNRQHNDRHVGLSANLAACL